VKTQASNAITGGHTMATIRRLLLNLRMSLDSLAILRRDHTLKASQRTYAEITTPGIQRNHPESRARRHARNQASSFTVRPFRLWRSQPPAAILAPAVSASRIFPRVGCPSKLTRSGEICPSPAVLPLDRAENSENLTSDLTR
jgi:hypothetical protein